MELESCPFACAKLGIANFHNRANLNGSADTIGLWAVTKSAIRWAAPGPIPKPWPEKPLAITKPVISSIVSITGTASGVTSIAHPQLSSTLALANSGNAFLRLLSPPLRIFPKAWVENPGCFEGGDLIRLPPLRGIHFPKELTAEAKSYFIPFRPKGRKKLEEQTEAMWNDLRNVRVFLSDCIATVKALAKREIPTGDRTPRRSVKLSARDRSDDLQLREIDAQIAAE